MSRLFQTTLFVLVNIMGFLATPLCYYIGVYAGVISSAADPLAVKALMNGVMITWIICAIFSFSSFFLTGAARAFFLIVPAIIPLGYGLRLIFLPL